jgi:hypothetical protein
VSDERLEGNFKGYGCISARRECHFERDSPLKFCHVIPGSTRTSIQCTRVSIHI